MIFDYRLRNNDLEVTIRSKGAEIISVKNRKNGREYMWNGNKDVWGRHAPLLFPYVGKLHIDTLTYDGESYKGNTQHGFARDSEFSLFNGLESNSETNVELSLEYNDETLTRYPFKFLLLVHYQLEGNRLIQNVLVKNLEEKKDLYFSFGFHPAFSCPQTQDGKLNEYQIRFDSKVTENPFRLDKGFFNERIDTSITLQDSVLPLSKSLFENDVVIFQSLENNQKVTLEYLEKPLVSLQFANLPYIGIWSKNQPGSEFICIEPWHGIADKSESMTPFNEKKGIIVLQEYSEIWKTSLEFEFHS